LVWLRRTAEEQEVSIGWSSSIGAAAPQLGEDFERGEKRREESTEGEM
jgi:hypothetical protein